MRTDDEMVERAAEAAYMADIADLKAESDMWLSWETLAKIDPTIATERYRKMARAVIDVMLADERAHYED